MERPKVPVAMTLQAVSLWQGKPSAFFIWITTTPRDRQPEPKRNNPDFLPVDNFRVKARDLWLQYEKEGRGIR